ncbi:MAG: response regulator [Nitrospirae bacterium]|nr:response regulator [Nitrospirota bacterium]
MAAGLQLMIIDDEPIVGKRLKRMFEKEGYAVETFLNGASAIEALEKKHFDIIVTDLMMGSVDGMKVLDTAVKKNAGTRVIIITGFGDQGTIDEALNKGASDFLIKPFKFEELYKAVKKAESGLKAT